MPLVTPNTKGQYMLSFPMLTPSLLPPLPPGPWRQPREPDLTPTAGHHGKLPPWQQRLWAPDHHRSVSLRLPTPVTWLPRLLCVCCWIHCLCACLESNLVCVFCCARSRPGGLDDRQPCQIQTHRGTRSNPSDWPGVLHQWNGQLPAGLDLSPSIYHSTIHLSHFPLPGRQTLVKSSLSLNHSFSPPLWMHSW